MSERLLSIEQVADKVSFSASWIRERVRLGKFPRQIAFEGQSRWREAEIDEWIVAHAAEPRGVREAPIAIRRSA